MKYKSIFRELFWNYRKFLNRRLIKKSNLFWKENRNKYLGQRGFVIGNGPSLKINDLDLLKDEITIASNKIYLAFEQTKWRPTILTVFDRLLWKEINDEIYKYYNPIFISHDRTPVKHDKTIIIKNNGYFGYEKSNGFSKNVIDGLWGGRTVTYNNIQIACHLGLNPIYLIGCDHNYIEKIPDKKKSNKTKHEGSNNHFIDGYRNTGQIVNFAPIDIMTSAYENAKEACEKKNINIFNATRGGHLEVFERIAFVSLF